MPTPPAGPPAAEPPRRVIARLDPNLADSPLRRALYDANLRPVTPTPNPEPEYEPADTEPTTDDEEQED